MTPIEDFFDRIFVVNLDRRPERWAHSLEQFRKLGITKFERFSAYDRPLDHNKMPSGAIGCTASHRAIFELVAYNKWPRVLILEDDFGICCDDVQGAFAESIKTLPADWEMFYLGANYIEPLVARVSDRILKIGRTMTTSSYGVTWQFCRSMAPYLSGSGPIDCIFGDIHRERKCYSCEPRIFCQYPFDSDLTLSPAANHRLMLNPHYVRELDERIRREAGN